MIKGWHVISEKKVYYGTDGSMRYGEQLINGKWYYFNKTTGAMITGWYNLPGKRVYYGSDGSMVHGRVMINGQYYNFDSVTGALIMNDMEVKAQGIATIRIG